MSFYRTLIAVAAIGLASVAFAAETNTDATKATSNSTQSMANTQANDAAPMEKLNLNKATAKELAKIKGLNMTKARAIIAYRKKNGDFKSLDDLKEVKGFKKMNEETMKDIQDHLTIG
ncbi:MAG TPA: helix-hairpin-helix domain-containing protein [Gammaproteobacteria bacterium]|nr:helix-hairpin-helix domain-containing protein [Gammaproteobacteria bacterium]